MNNRYTKPPDTSNCRETNSRQRSKTFDSFRNPAYRLFYGGLVGQWFSMNAQIVARSLLIYRISGSGVLLGVVAIANAVPAVIFSPLGGAMADRMQKRNILLYTQLGSAVISLSITLSLITGYLSPQRPDSWWILIVSALFQGVVMGFMMPARQAIVPEIVSKEQVMNATSLTNMGMNVFQLIAPALAGFLIDAFNFAFVYFLSTCFIIFGTVCIAIMPRTRVMTNVRFGNTLSVIREGVQFIRHNNIILLVVIVSLLGMALGFPFRQLMPMFTEDILNVGATGMGILLGVSGIGAIVTSLILASLPNRKRGMMLLLSIMVLGLALIGFAFSRWWLLSLIIVLFVGLGLTAQRTLGSTLIQYYVDIEYRGRVMSFFMMGIGLASLGTFFGGLIAEIIGIQWSIGGLAIILTLITVIIYVFIPQLRNLD